MEPKQFYPKIIHPNIKKGLEGISKLYTTQTLPLEFVTSLGKWAEYAFKNY